MRACRDIPRIQKRQAFIKLKREEEEEVEKEFSINVYYVYIVERSSLMNVNFNCRIITRRII